MCGLAHVAAQAGQAQVRGCVFDRASQVGAFAALPLTDAAGGGAAQAGLRYSSPELSVGFTSQPFQAALKSLWAVRPLGGPALSEACCGVGR